jgi:hypothetical protein
MMKKKWILVFSVLMIAAFLSGALVVSRAGIVFILNTHSIWTNNDGLVVLDGQSGCELRVFKEFETISAWSEYDGALFPAIAQFRGTAYAEGTKSCPEAHTYEFILMETSASEATLIEGTWNVYRDNSLVCSLCNGAAINMDSPVTGSYRVAVDDPIYGMSAWQYHGYVDQRKDFTNP